MNAPHNDEVSTTQIAELISIWRNDIPLFAQQMFDTILRPKQIEMANAFKDNKRVSIRGGVGFGKTHVLSIIAWWSVVCHSDVLVSVFGPSEQQLDTGAWRAIMALHSKMKEPFKSAFSVTATKVERISTPANCRIEKKLANANNVSSLCGVHEMNNFIICDEAVGVEDVVFTDAFQNIFSDFNPKLLLISNPSKLSGFFYRTHNDPTLSQQWKQIVGKASDNPLLTTQQLLDMEIQYGGKHSNLYQVMVEGEFPSDAVSGLIDRNLCVQAVQYEVTDNKDTIIWGLDPAGDGSDRSVLCIRKGKHLIDFHSWTGLDSVQLADAVIKLKNAQPANMKPATIAVDVIGNGYGVASVLKNAGIDIKSVKTNNKPSAQRERFKDLKAQLWWKAKEWFETEEVQIADNKEFIDELCVTGYNTDSGRIAIENKRNVRKKLGGKSTDYADAFILTFSVSSNRVGGKYAFNKPIKYDNLSQYE